MENFERMINEVIENLDWRMILGFYEKLDLTWYGKDLSKKNRLEKRNPTIEELKNELKTICRFVVQKGVTDYVYDHWTIIYIDPNDYEDDEYFKDDFGAQLEVIFSPTRSLSFENMVEYPGEEEEENVSQIEMEMVILEDLLNKSVAKEEYEAASKYRDKIIDLRREIKKGELKVPVQINKRKGK